MASSVFVTTALGAGTVPSCGLDPRTLIEHLHTARGKRMPTSRLGSADHLARVHRIRRGNHHHRLETLLAGLLTGLLAALVVHLPRSFLGLLQIFDLLARHLDIWLPGRVG